MAVRGLACERGPESSIAPSATTLQPHYCTTPPLYYLLPMHAQDWFLAIVAILLPPVAVAIKRGICSADCMYFPLAIGLLLVLYQTLILLSSHQRCPVHPRVHSRSDPCLLDNCQLSIR